MLTVAVQDQNGSPATTFNGTVHFASTPPLPASQLPADYTFTAIDLGAGAKHTFNFGPAPGISLTTPGAFTITVRDTAALLVTASVAETVKAGPAFRLAVSLPPGAPPTTSQGAVPFAVTAYDTYGNIATGYTGTVTFSSSDTNNPTIPSAYTFTSTDNGKHPFSASLYTPGSQSITVTDNTVTPSITAFATVTITSTPVDSILQGKLTAVASTITRSDEYLTNLINNAYLHYLGRGPDAGGFVFWFDNLKNKGLTDEYLEAGFFSSPEFIRNQGGLNDAWVDAIYLSDLGRLPDPTGHAFWVSQIVSGQQTGITLGLQTGMTQEAIATAITLGFTRSPEREGQRVDHDYQFFLGRPGDQGGHDFWVNEFRSGRMTNEGLVAGFVGSPEYYQKPTKGRGNNSDWITAAYLDILGRQPNSAEIGAASAALL